MSAHRGRRRGRVLYIGSSYYNNWYLSHALRARGWTAETFAHAGEGSEAYLHGGDHFLSAEELRDHMPPNAEATAAVTAATDAFGGSGPAPPARRGGLGLSARTLAARARVAASRGRLEPEARGELVARLVEAVTREQRQAPLAALFRALMQVLCPDPPPGLLPVVQAIDRYDIFHFTGINSMRLLYFVAPTLFGSMPVGWDVDVLRRLGKRIVYTNVGCMDGVSQSAFRKWGPTTVCDICRWRDVPEVCSDAGNLRWGAMRNALADYIILLGGNRADHNDDPRAHEVPEFYCLDPDVWRPDLVVPDEHRLDLPPGTVRIYHAVGSYDTRTDTASKKNIKTTHIVLPAIERLKAEGLPVDLVFCHDKPNRDVRFYQAQADIVVDMLTFGFFGANVREAMMLGKVAVCFLRPEWLESMRAEIPDYVDELPVVSATPETVVAVLRDLVNDPARRAEIGRRSRAFAIKWHSAEAAGRRFDRIYGDLLGLTPGLPPAAATPPPPGPPAAIR